MYILAIGAHPDDIEGHIGGTMALFRELGDHVKFVSVTDGSKGHYAQKYIADPDALSRRRLAEITAATGLIGAEYECMGIPDGEVYVTPANTEAMVRLIRSYGLARQGPDLVLTNRPTDYHRDHRYTAQLVLDATYMLTVPPMCPDTRNLDRMPVFAYWHDDFTEGGVFRADVVVPIDATIETKINMACKHASQFFEWLPYNAGVLAEFPTDEACRRERLAEQYKERAAAVRNKYASALPDDQACNYAEAFQISEYGRRPESGELSRLFPITTAEL